MSELSPGDARALLARHVADAPARLDAFLGSVRALGGPADRLDRSLGSLDLVWPWFLEAASQAQRKVEADVPWWAPFHPAWVRALGDTGAALATGLSEYLVACIVAHAPAATWVVGQRASNRRHPVLAIPGRGEMDYAVPLGFAVRALTDPLPADRERGALRRLAEIWLGLDQEHEEALASLARPMGPWAVRLVEQGRFTHELSFEDSVAHRRTSQVERTLEALAAEPSVVEVAREDREVALVRAPDLSAEEMASLVDRLWAGAPRPHGDATSTVP